MQCQNCQNSDIERKGRRRDKAPVLEINMLQALLALRAADTNTSMYRETPCILENSLGNIVLLFDGEIVNFHVCSLGSTDTIH